MSRNSPFGRMVSPALNRDRSDPLLYPERVVSMRVRMDSTESRTSSGLTDTPFRLTFTE